MQMAVVANDAGHLGPWLIEAQRAVEQVDADPARGLDQGDAGANIPLVLGAPAPRGVTLSGGNPRQLVGN